MVAERQPFAICIKKRDDSTTSEKRKVISLARREPFPENHISKRYPPMPYI